MPVISTRQKSFPNKLSSLALFTDGILLHVSRPMRWDSDHVVSMDDELIDIGRELVRGDLLGKTHIGLDFFDASINRVAAWVIGTRNTIKALLRAMLEPVEELREAELQGDYTTRLALTEEFKIVSVRSGMGLLLRQTRRSGSRRVVSRDQGIREKRAAGQRKLVVDITK